MRRRPYTERGIQRVPCARCGAPSTQQWQVCGDGNQYRGLCPGCDVSLNKLVMDFMGLPFDQVAYARSLGLASIGPISLHRKPLTLDEILERMATERAS